MNDILADAVRRVAEDGLDFEGNAKRLRELAGELGRAAFAIGQDMDPPQLVLDPREEVLLDAAISLEMLTKFYREREGK